MLFSYLLKKPWAVLSYGVLIVFIPRISVRITYQTATLLGAVRTADADQMLSILLKILVLFLVCCLLQYWSGLLKRYILSCARRTLKADLFRNLVQVSRTFFEQQGSGSHITAFSNDISILEYKYFEAVLEGAESVLVFAAYFSAIFTLQPLFGGIVFFFELTALLICFFMRRENRKRSRIYIDTLAGFTQAVGDYFASRFTIWNYAAEEGVERAFQQQNRQTEQAKSESELAVAFTDAFAHFIRCMGAYAIVAFGAVQVLHMTMTFSSVYAAYSFANNLSNPIKTIIGKFNDIQASRSVSRKIAAVIRARREEGARLDTDAPFEGIHLDQVSVRRDGQEILSQISFDFEPGKKYLILGRNGSGKSTLLRLLVRSYDGYEGSVTLCGTELRDLAYPAVARRVSYINENVSLLTGTVYDNIALFGGASREQVDQVMARVGLTVPQERFLRDGGKNISSGEKRRIEIARCLLTGPDVLIFDEAVSTLDIPTAYGIEKMMLHMPDKTVIFVSHNFSSRLLEQYDQILFLDRGRLTASGTHRSLLADSPDYRRLIQIKCGGI